MSSIFTNFALLITLCSGFTTESDVAYIRKMSRGSTDIIPRKTSSNPIIGSKKGLSANGAKKRIKGPADDSEPEVAHLQEIGGLSEEDDTLEREAAISSPLKGTDSHGSAKVNPQFSISIPPVYLGHDKGQEREWESQAQSRSN